VKSVEKYCPQRQTCSDCMENHQLPQVCSLWNGFIKQVTSGLDFYGSKIIFLSFIRTPPTDYDTVFISPFEDSERSKGHFQKTCFVTFDQPLFFKTRDIVEGGQHSELSCVVVRLGEFHLLMSFMGCIGAIMAGSCLKALFMTIYTDHRPGQDAEWSCLFTSCTSTHFD
jgi:hypothetical protein